MMPSAQLLLAARTQEELQIEMVRMCIAEAGYDPNSIQPYDGSRPGFAFVCNNNAIPVDVCWRARELAGVGRPKCLRCTMHDRFAEPDGGCEADRRLVPDCGRDESDDVG